MYVNVADGLCVVSLCAAVLEQFGSHRRQRQRDLCLPLHTQDMNDQLFPAKKKS